MKKILTFGLLTITIRLIGQPIYGDNNEAGQFTTINGVRIYYETYGMGDPLVIVHGHRSSISGMKNQIEYFSKKYKVLIADTRAHGKTEVGDKKLSYELMAEDIKLLMDKMEIDSAMVVGYSDGGVIGLIMAMKYPVKVKKLVTISACIKPDTTAVSKRAVESIKNQIVKANEMIAKNDTTNNWTMEKIFGELLLYNPNYDFKDLNKIMCPTLIMQADRDVIKQEHSFQIYRSIKKANLSIMPGLNHSLVTRDPVFVNTTIDRFISNPFRVR
ncbi:MAG: alpha/beta hydrolase [Cytophagales bacterium]|nr:alpha/beta hydrolase [Cytophagales bacterium]